MTTINKTARRTIAVAMSLALALSGGVVSLDSQAKTVKKPTVTESLSVSVDSSKTIKVKKNSYKVISVKATSKDTSVAKVGKVSKTSVKIKGVSAGNTKITVKVKVYKKDKKGNNTKKKQTLKYTTSVTVKDEKPAESPTVTPPAPSTPGTNTDTKQTTGLIGTVDIESAGFAYAVGDTFTLTAVAQQLDPNASLTYTWIKAVNDSNFQVVGRSNTLTVSSAQVNDSGYYYCSVTAAKRLSEQTVVSNVVPIHIGSDVQPIPTSTDVSVIAGSSAGAIKVKNDSAGELQYQVRGAGALSYTTSSTMYSIAATTTSSDISTDDDGNALEVGSKVFIWRATDAGKQESSVYTVTITSAMLSGGGSSTASLSASMISVGAMTYNGSVQTPSVTVNPGTGAVSQSGNYTVSYKQGGSSIDASAIKNAGMYTVVITADPSSSVLSGSAEKDFTIGKATATISLAPETFADLATINQVTDAKNLVNLTVTGVGSDSITATWSAIATGGTLGSLVGSEGALAVTATVTALSDSTNYDIPTSISGNPASVTVPNS